MSDLGLQAIQSRIASLRHLTTNESNAARSLGSTAEFDAFGATYQDAIEARDNGISLGQTSGISGAGGSFGAIATPSMYGGGGAGASGIALTAAVQGRAGAPGARPVGGYGSMPVPDTLRAYGNGQIPTGALAEISQSGHRLYAPAAASWNSLVAAARAEGIDLRITDSYRSYEQQVDLANRKGLYSEGGLAARPGTSNHGWGLAVDADVTDARTRQWLQVNGPRFGWVEAVPREPWHWEFRPHQV